MIRASPEILITKNSVERDLNEESKDMSAGDFVNTYQYLEIDNPRVRSSKHWKNKEVGSLLRHYHLAKFEEIYNDKLSEYKKNL